MENNFRPRMMKLRSSGAIVFDHPCQSCGKPHAPFGRKVSLWRAPKNLGEWFCDKKCEVDFDAKTPDQQEFRVPQQPVQFSLF